MSKKIVVIPGDGIGQEITDSAVAVLKKVSDKYNLNLEFESHPAGGTAYDYVAVLFHRQHLKLRKMLTLCFSVLLVVQNGIM